MHNDAQNIYMIFFQNMNEYFYLSSTSEKINNTIPLGIVEWHGKQI